VGTGHVGIRGAWQETSNKEVWVLGDVLAMRRLSMAENTVDG